MKVRKLENGPDTIDTFILWNYIFNKRESLQPLMSESVSETSIVVRPWGTYEVLHQRSGEHFLVKKIIVEPESRLSLQTHTHRSEHWVVISGRGEAVVGDDTLVLGPGTHVFIPKNTKHRLINPNASTILEIVEVQCGEILSEEDIVRHEDDYQRNQ